jgi:hypothetical protein
MRIWECDVCHAQLKSTDLQLDWEDRALTDRNGLPLGWEWVDAGDDQGMECCSRQCALTAVELAIQEAAARVKT